ncbi:MAG: DoxX family protein [Cypionkella sp.]|uniref:DoxX family protein n=1 Tax=Cypionkella sp. TaxID=2811411 RepID=UPI002ABC411D|nr:DoxX family protein [Cypionkella sp.]MDZ4312916.1 DoxX family protein [Cypionkella sp.]
MDKLSPYAPLVARIFIGALFLIAGFGKLGDVAGFAGYMASAGLPTFLAWPAVIFELALGASMILGFQTRIMALLGAGFCIVAAVLYHNPSDPAQMTNFLKNFAIAGGFLMLFAHGAGKPALDKR